MSRLPIKIKERALRLRLKGYSIKEISDKLGIAKSTSSLWFRNIELDKKAQDRLRKRRLLGSYKTSLRWRKKRIKEEKEYNYLANNILNKISKNKNHAKTYCALLYWCEGEKTTASVVRFMNSDPRLIKIFITLFRKSFPAIKKEKFRALMHLHEYHDEYEQKRYWSKITGIPQSQFHKTYNKPHTAKRIREGYPGCINISYCDAKIAKELTAIYRNFSKIKMGV